MGGETTDLARPGWWQPRRHRVRCPSIPQRAPPACRARADEETPMLTGWFDFDDTLRTFDRLQRRLDRALDPMTDPVWVRARPRRAVAPVAWPPTNVYETKEAFLVKAEIPGVAEGDVSVSVEEEMLVLRGERKSDVPAGYRVHQR